MKNKVSLLYWAFNFSKGPLATTHDPSLPLKKPATAQGPVI